MYFIPCLVMVHVLGKLYLNRINKYCFGSACDENVNLCGVDTKIVTHSGRRSQLLLSAMRCGHPSSYIGSSVDRASLSSLIVFH